MKVFDQLKKKNPNAAIICRNFIAQFSVLKRFSDICSQPISSLLIQD